MEEEDSPAGPVGGAAAAKDTPSSSLTSPENTYTEEKCHHTHTHTHTLTPSLYLSVSSL